MAIAIHPQRDDGDKSVSLEPWPEPGPGPGVPTGATRRSIGQVLSLREPRRHPHEKQARMSQKPKPDGAVTVVLVHGALADSSSWNGVIERLQAKGVHVTAAANPLRGISIDSAYLAGVFEETRAPSWRSATRTAAR